MNRPNTNNGYGLSFTNVRCVVKDANREFENLLVRTTELSGRALGPWFTEALHRNGKVYVAAAKDGDARKRYGLSGFIIERVTEGA